LDNVERPSEGGIVVKKEERKGPGAQVKGRGREISKIGSFDAMYLRKV
jgi:hypothetical protein